MVAFFAERARLAGKRCLVACFNRPLADELRDALPPDVVVETLHGVALRIATAAGHALDVAADANRPGFWPGVLGLATDTVLGEGPPPEWRFDALVVDEGQDINDDGHQLLRLLLPEGADVVWMEDANQRLYDAAPFDAAGFVTYRCRDNHRTPQRIAAFARALLPSFAFDARNPLPGDAVRAVETAPAAPLEAALARRVEQLVQAGYAPAQIVVLTGRGLERSAVVKADRIGRHATRRPDGYTAPGRARYTEGELRVETLMRFKGQQAPAVIVCELDGDPADPAVQRRLYVAATRATARLEFLLPRGSPLLAPMRRAVGLASDAQDRAKI
jgi:hypothetical protein